MSRARTFTRAEMDDAARLAAEHGLAIRFEPDGVLVMQPVGSALDNADETSAESALAEWKNKRAKTPRRPHH